MSYPKSQQFYSFSSPSTQTNRNYNKFENLDISARVKKSAHNYKNYTRINAGDIQFKVNKANDEYGICSPPLWKPSTPNQYGNLSPNYRTKAIAKGQMELMEMARKMPESCYELSLRDMVESPVVESPKLDDEKRLLVSENKIERMKSGKENVKRRGNMKVGKRIERVKSTNFENGGLFLKMVFPVSMRSKRRKKLAITTSDSKKVSPKVESLEKSYPGKDLWKKIFSGSSGSESVESCVTNTSSRSSKSTTNRKVEGRSCGCWSFALSRKNKRKPK